MYVCMCECMSTGGVNGSGNSAADQIPLLLKMNEDELALQKVWDAPFYISY